MYIWYPLLSRAAQQTVKFTWDWSHKSVNYLDVTIISDNGKFTTDLFVKPTDKHQYLDFRSCHPRGCKRSIPYAQALRLRRICSSDELFDPRATELTGFLCTRGYEGEFVKQQVQRAKRLSRVELFTPATESTCTGRQRRR